MYNRVSQHNCTVLLYHTLLTAQMFHLRKSKRPPLPFPKRKGNGGRKNLHSTCGIALPGYYIRGAVTLEKLAHARLGLARNMDGNHRCAPLARLSQIRFLIVRGIIIKSLAVGGEEWGRHRWRTAAGAAARRIGGSNRYRDNTPCAIAGIVNAPLQPIDIHTGQFGYYGIGMLLLKTSCNLCHPLLLFPWSRQRPFPTLLAIAPHV
jgi:hypothetical protein